MIWIWKLRDLVDIICSLANVWSNEMKALMIATCLIGEALAFHKSLNRKDYERVLTVLRAAFKPEDINFTSLSAFMKDYASMRDPQKILFELIRLLKKSYPEMPEEAREQLLLNNIYAAVQSRHMKISYLPGRSDIKLSNENSSILMFSKRTTVRYSQIRCCRDSRNRIEKKKNN